MRRGIGVGWVVFAAAMAVMFAWGSLGRSRNRNGLGGRENSVAKTGTAVKSARWFEIPLGFERYRDKRSLDVQFFAEGKGMAVGLGGQGISVIVGGSIWRDRTAQGIVRVRFEEKGKAADNLEWSATERLPGEANYLIGRDPASWRLHVARYGMAEAGVFAGVRTAVYGRQGELEYDLRVSPGTRADKLGIQLAGAERLRLDADGNLWMRVAERDVEMKRPTMYEVSRRETRRTIRGGYVIRGKGRVGFWVGPHDERATVVIDPSLTMNYTTFLGGPGGTQANSVAVDSLGNVYVAGNTVATGAFPGTRAQSLGSTGASSYLYVAKLNPQTSGPASLDWLTFIGGSASQAGGVIAVDSHGNAAIAGTTTSADYPVTDGSTLKTGGNSAVVTEIDQATGATLEFSTMLGGSGMEWNENGGGVAIDGDGKIYVASDTTSVDLCAGAATATPYQATYGGGSRDGFLAMYQPGATPSLRYCTYLGIFAEVGVTGLALDTKENAYLAGFTSQPVNPTEFPATTNGFQANYSGGAYDGFIVKISPSGNGLSDLSYASYLGGTGSDKAMAIAVDSSQFPATAYVAGTTDSKDFPIGAVAGYQPNQNSGLGGTNAFLVVVTQSGSGKSALAYATYLGGSQSDAATAVAELAPNGVYIAGSATSTDFPWLGNLQPLSADTDAFVAELDTTVPGSNGLRFATPVGGTPSAGLLGTTSANGLAAMNVAGGSGSVQLIVAGDTNTLDFPQAPGASGTGVELTCPGCPALADGFATEIEEQPAGAAGPSVEFTPAVVRFKASGPTTPVNIGIKNMGDAELTISSIALSQAGSDFSLLPASPCANQSLEPQSSGLCSFEVTFAGTGAVTEGATIVISDNAPGGAQVLQVAGVSGDPEGTLSASTLDFGDVPSGTTGGPLYVTLTNTGGLPLEVTQITSSSGEFPVLATGGAGVGAGCSTIPAGMSCLLGVEFKPTAAGSANATLTLTDNSGNVAGATQTVTLTGTGTSGGPMVSVAPATVPFGTQQIGTTSGAQIVTLANIGTANLRLTSVSIGGGGGDFAIPSGWQNACPLQGGSIAPGGSCVVPLTFAPKAAGSVSGSLNFFDNAGTGEQSVALSGTGQGTIAVSVMPTSIAFTSASVGTKTAATTVTVANTGSAPLEITSVGVVGTDAPDFPETTTCTGSVLPGKSCVVQVTFVPTASGARTAILNVGDDAAGSPQSVSLSGTATQAAATLSPASLNFSPGQLAGTASTPQTVTLNSTGNGSLAVSKISFPGTDPGDFSETDNCTGSVTIPAGKSCTIQVMFKPLVQDVQCGTNATARCATLTVADNTPSSPQVADVTGTMMDFEIEPPTGESFAQTVTAGGTATYNLEVDSIGGFTGTVALACSEPTEITGTSCSISTGSVNVTANAATTFTVSVPTTGASTTTTSATAGRSGRDAAWKTDLKFEMANWNGLEGIALVASILALTFLGTRKRARLVGATLVIAGVVTCVSCGGGGANTAASDPPVATPSGTYTNAFAITATTSVGSTTVQRTAQLTLVVQ